jgi:hypothetical protein
MFSLMVKQMGLRFHPEHGSVTDQMSLAEDVVNWLKVRTKVSVESLCVRIFGPYMIFRIGGC